MTSHAAFPQGDLFTPQYYTEPVTSFPSSPVMLAYPQGDLFTAQYCSEPVTSFPHHLSCCLAPRETYL